MMRWYVGLLDSADEQDTVRLLRLAMEAREYHVSSGVYSQLMR